jgi:hypothetical protein
LRSRSFSGLLAILFAVAPLSALADPPAHAPAHGYRAKHIEEAPKQPEAEPRKGIEVIFDSERGIYVGVNLSDVLFHDGRYYRESDGRWEVSLSGDGGWSISASSSVPEIVVKAKHAHPGPAKAEKRSWKGKKK